MMSNAKQFYSETDVSFASIKKQPNDTIHHQATRYVQNYICTHILRAHTEKAFYFLEHAFVIF